MTYGLSTVEMAAAYSAFANNGVYNEPKTYVKVLANDNTTVILEKETEQHVAMKETTAYLMTNTAVPGGQRVRRHRRRRPLQRHAHRRQDRYQ